MPDISIRDQIMGKGFDQISSLENDIAKAINNADEMNQLDLIEIQQMTAQYTATISLMSNILKDLSDSDSEVIRNT